MPQAEVDSAIYSLTSRQGGFVTRSQAIEAGASDMSLTRRVRSGRLLRSAPGVYRVPGMPERPEDDLWRALLTAGPKSVVSHRSAAWLHGTRAQAVLGTPEISYPHPGHPRVRDVTVYQPRIIRPEDVVLKRGLRVTSPARTVIDLSATCSRGFVANIVDEWQATDVVSAERVRQRFELAVRDGKRGLRNIAAVVDDLFSVPTVRPGYLERRLRDLCQAARVGHFTLEARLPTPDDGAQFADVRVHDSALIVEGDGRTAHRRLTQWKIDRDRDRVAAEAGLLPVRFTTEDLVNHFDRSVRQLQRIHLMRIAQLNKAA